MIDNALLKFAYPKKIRALVEELERTGELNSEAVRKANKFIYKSSVGSAIIFVMFSIILVTGTEWSQWVIGGAGTISPFYLTKREGRKVLEPAILCFCFGHRTEGRIIKDYYGQFWVSKYSYSVDGQDYKQEYHWPPFLWSTVHRKGDPITVYYLEDEPHKSVPDIGRLKLYFKFKGNM